MSSIGRIVRKNHSAVFWCTRHYPKAKREAVYTLYALVKHLDDLSSSNLPKKEKEDILQAWRRELVNIPIVGSVAAGEPIFAQQNIEGYMPMLPEYMPGGEAFMLKVKGESMINAGIFDGDRVLVKKQESAENGDMVVALVDDSATVKTFYREDGHIRLQPENDFMDPIIVDDVKIVGKVAGLFRVYK